MIYFVERVTLEGNLVNCPGDIIGLSKRLVVKYRVVTHHPRKEVAFLGLLNTTNVLEINLVKVIRTIAYFDEF